MRTPDLKPCPFCGGEPLLMQRDNTSWYVTCNSCQARTKEHVPKTIRPWEIYDAIKDAVNKTVDAWNSRANDELQAENAQQARCIENMTDKLNAMNDEAAKLQAERDAAVADVALFPDCSTCKYDPRKKGYIPNDCDDCIEHCNYKWRGVQKEN